MNEEIKKALGADNVMSMSDCVLRIKDLEAKRDRLKADNDTLWKKFNGLCENIYELQDSLKGATLEVSGRDAEIARLKAELEKTISAANEFQEMRSRMQRDRPGARPPESKPIL